MVKTYMVGKGMVVFLQSTKLSYKVPILLQFDANWSQNFSEKNTSPQRFPAGVFQPLS